MGVVFQCYFILCLAFACYEFGYCVGKGEKFWPAYFNGALMYGLWPIVLLMAICLQIKEHRHEQ